MRKSKEKLSCGGREEFWSEHVESWRASGLSQKSYARQAGIGRGSLGYWKRKLERVRPLALSHPIAVPVPIELFPGNGIAEAKGTPQGGAFRLNVGTYGIEIPPDFTVPALIRLLDCLERRQ